MGAAHAAGAGPRARRPAVQTLPALLAASDVVSLHLPLTPQTKGSSTPTRSR
jgi:phosphoglycerate dehydrogenase-like enzyme